MPAFNCLDSKDLGRGISILEDWVQYLAETDYEDCADATIRLGDAYISQGKDEKVEKLRRCVRKARGLE